MVVMEGNTMTNTVAYMHLRTGDKFRVETKKRDNDETYVVLNAGCPSGSHVFMSLDQAQQLRDEVNSMLAQIELDEQDQK